MIVVVMMVGKKERVVRESLLVVPKVKGELSVDDRPKGCVVS